VFQEPADSLVRGLKDGRRRALAAVLAGVMATRVCPPEPPCPLVPVPVGRRRRAERGFDQAEMIARELGRRWARPVEPLLVRVREGPDQRGASASARVRQVARAFAVHPRAGVMPESAILVDDVHTTGATLAACARALRSAGVRSVGAVCFARALAGRPGWRG
jgi:ComF family protein